MDGTKRLALRREREARAPVVLQGGFRPFFLASALWFLLAMALWLAVLAGAIALPSHFGTLAWHRHELIFGGVGAAMTGYLLTATPNWSGRLPAIGTPLLAMLIWWMLARATNAFAGWAGPWPAAAIDAGFFFALAFVCGRESWHGKGRGALNAVLVGMFAVACAAHHLSGAGIGVGQPASGRAGIAILVVMISLIGGKLVPSFTRNALPAAVRSAVTAQNTRFDPLVNSGSGLAVLLWVAETGEAAHVALTIAGLLQTARAIGWQPWRVMHEPSTLSLHIGYAWLPLGLLALAFINDSQQPAITHLLTAGAISCMILAVMARMSITQTGRQPRWRIAPLIAVLLASAGAAVRIVAGTELIPVQEGWFLAGALWMLGFALFLLAFGPIFFRPRARRK